MKLVKSSLPLVLTFLFCALIFGQNKTNIDYKVFNMLNLNTAGLEHVKKQVGLQNYDKAAKALLKYYRNRTHIGHPEINASDKSNWLGKKIGKLDAEKANKGLEHQFFVHKGYGYLDYGKDINWDYWPVKDNEIRWQVNRMYWWIPMGKMYWSTADEKYAEEWILQFRDWVKDNPRGLSKENDRFAWRPLECSRRVQDQTTLFNFFIDSKNFTSEFLVEFLLNYHEHAEWVSGNYTKKGNHRLFQAQRMIYGGGFFQEFKNAERWRKEGIDILNNQMSIQILDDGFQYELSQNYHVGGINTFLKGLKMAQLCNLENEFPAAYLATIKKMIYANIKASFPDMSYPMFGDSKLEYKKDMAKKYRAWTEFFPNDKVLQFFASKGRKGKAPDFLSTRLPVSGFTALRNGWDDNSTALIMRAGIPGGWFHSQPDNGTFELWHKGVNLMPDSGVYVYAGDKEIMKLRNWFRQSAVHQTLTLNDKDIVVDAKQLKWHRSSNLDYLVYENESYNNLKHRRSVFFVDKTFYVILDEAIGEATGDVKIRFQIKEGEAAYNFKTNQFWSNNMSQPNIMVHAFSENVMATTEENLKVSYGYREELPRKGVAFSILKENDQTVRMVSIVYPEDGKVKPLNASCELIKKSDDNINIELIVKGKKYHLGYQL